MRSTVLASLVLTCWAGTCLLLASPHTLKGTQPIVTHSVYGSQECFICHGYNYDPDRWIEPSDTWAGTMMAQSARDPLFWSALDVANHDVPGIGDFCLRCHTPGAWLDGRSEPPLGSPDGCALQGRLDDPFSTDFDGVTCHLCHRMMVNPSPPPGEQPFYLENAQYWIDDSDCDGQGEPCRRGPYEYLGGPMEFPPPHPYAFSPYHRRSDLCGTCHNVTNPVRNLIVNGVDQGIRFPMERTHKEWERSAYAVPGPVEATCQSCHMPKVTADPVYACVFADNNRSSNMRMHAFVGGNAWVPDVIRQAYPMLMIEDELALIRAAAIDLLEHRSAAVAITVASHVVPGSALQAAVKVTNLTGHKLPTGYPEGRRMWLHVTARDGALAPIWESGAYDASSGVLTQDAALKVYRADEGVWNRNGTESCDHADPLGRPLFHAVMNDCIALDNRIPPLGFRGGTDLELRPVGHSYPETFPGSGMLVNYDQTSYTIPIPPGAVSPITVTAELRYQTTSKEYVDFQRDEAVANAFPNDCIERVNGPLNNSRGGFLHDLWTQYGRAAPVTMGAASGASTLVAHVTPGEASRAVDMRVTSYDRATGDVTISYQPACGSTDHTVYVGSLSALPSMTYSAAFCNRGASGTTTFRPAGSALFWVIVGNQGSDEGSYGRSSLGVERPEAVGLPGCDLPQNLDSTCDP